jgi:hypothetical protein
MWLQYSIYKCLCFTFIYESRLLQNPPFKKQVLDPTSSVLVISRNRFFLSLWLDLPNSKKLVISLWKAIKRRAICCSLSPSNLKMPWWNCPSSAHSNYLCKLFQSAPKAVEGRVLVGVLQQFVIPPDYQGIHDPSWLSTWRQDRRRIYLGERKNLRMKSLICFMIDHSFRWPMLDQVQCFSILPHYCTDTLAGCDTTGELLLEQMLLLHVENVKVTKVKSLWSLSWF